MIKSNAVGQVGQEAGARPRRKNIMGHVTRASVAFVAIFGLLEGSANATIYLQAATGHPHFGTASWDSEWNTANGFTIDDGRSIRPNGTVARIWDTPIPITTTNVNWNVFAIGFSDPVNGFVTNRICTFNAFGAFSSCGATVTAQTGGAPTSTAFVPSTGTAYSQTFFAGVNTFRALFHVVAF